MLINHNGISIDYTPAFMKVNDPTIVLIRVEYDTPCIVISGNVPILDVLKEHPPTEQLIRFPSSGDFGVFVVGKGSTILRVFSSKDPGLDMYAAISKVLRGKGARVFQQGNDMFFIAKDGRAKKFLGSGVNGIWDGMISWKCSMSFKVYTDLMDRYIRTDTSKMIKKGEFSSFSEIVGGLEEVGITDDLQTWQEILDEFAARWDLELEYEKDFSMEEKLAFIEYSKRYKTVEWKENAALV